MKKGIVVSGVGEVRAAPDILAVTIDVETRASTVAAARTANAEAAARLIASLKAEGVDQRDIQTANLSVRAEYDRPDSGNPRVSGYRVTNSLRVLLRDTEKAGAAIDAALDAAGDDGRLGGLRFDFSDRPRFTPRHGFVLASMHARRRWRWPPGWQSNSESWSVWWKTRPKPSGSPACSRQRCAWRACQSKPERAR